LTEASNSSKQVNLESFWSKKHYLKTCTRFIENRLIENRYIHQSPTFVKSGCPCRSTFEIVILPYYVHKPNSLNFSLMLAETTDCKFW
jgi:hypothetical protein